MEVREYKINGRIFVIPELTLEMDERLMQFFGSFLTGEGLVQERIMTLINDNKKHRELISMMLVPKRWKIRDIFRGGRFNNWRDLRKMTNEQLEDIIKFFFGENGPLSSLSRIFSEKMDLPIPGTKVSKVEP